jgi:hypothetical protein
MTTYCYIFYSFICCNFEVYPILRFVLSDILHVAVAFLVKIVRVTLCFVGGFALKTLSRIVQLNVCLLSRVARRPYSVEKNYSWTWLVKNFRAVT